MLQIVMDRLDLRRRLHGVAFRQAGYFSAGQARELGYSYQAQKYHADRGNWVRIDRGLFRLADWPPGADDTYARWSVWSNGRGVISHESAADVHDIGDFDAGPVHLTRDRSWRSRSGVVLHAAALDPTDIQDRGTFLVTTVTRTLLDLAASAVSQEQLDVAVQDAATSARLARAVLHRRMDSFGPAAALRLERALTAVTV